MRAVTFRQEHEHEREDQSAEHVEEPERNRSRLANGISPHILDQVSVLAQEEVVACLELPQPGVKDKDHNREEDDHDACQNR